MTLRFRVKPSGHQDLPAERPATYNKNLAVLRFLFAESQHSQILVVLDRGGAELLQSSQADSMQIRKVFSLTGIASTVPAGGTRRMMLSTSHITAFLGDCPTQQHHGCTAVLFACQARHSASRMRHHTQRGWVVPSVTLGCLVAVASSCVRSLLCIAYSSLLPVPALMTRFAAP